MTSNLLMHAEQHTSVAFQAVLGAYSGLGMNPLRPGAEGSTLGPIENGTAEIRIGYIGIGKAALHQHGIAQQGPTQISLVQSGGENNGVLEIHAPQIGPLKIAAVEDSAPKIRTMKIHTLQVGFEKFLLLQVATMHIRLNLLEGPLPPQLRGRDGQG